MIREKNTAVKINLLPGMRDLCSFQVIEHQTYANSGSSLPAPGIAHGKERRTCNIKMHERIIGKARQEFPCRDGAPIGSTDIFYFRDIRFDQLIVLFPERKFSQAFV